ncbi:MAG TPA: hypothetical protein VHZ49_15770 [Methylomirabilota bacterium]|jgi:hypothetical protein|nr:hypothetical protein [Methylomirabilota bacterium]
MRSALAAALLLVSQTASPGILYDFEWRSSAMLSRLQGGETVTTRGELLGKGRLRLTRLADGRWHFAFWGPDGHGEGDIVGEQLQNVSFPVPIDVGNPAAPPHLTSGIFRPAADGGRPPAFELAWAEGFICRTTPATCGNVTAWSRELTGHAQLATP